MKRTDIFDALCDIDEALLDRNLSPAAGRGAQARRKWPVIAAAAVLAAAALCVLIPLILRRSRPAGPDEPGPEVPASVFDGLTVSGEVPDWYLPGELNVFAVSVDRSNLSSMSAAGTKGAGILSLAATDTGMTAAKPLPFTGSSVKTALYDPAAGGSAPVLPLAFYPGRFGDALVLDEIPYDPGQSFSKGSLAGEYQIIGDPGNDYIEVSTRDTESEHYYCAGQFVNLHTGEYICLHHRIAEKMGVEIIKEDIGGAPTHLIDTSYLFGNRCFVQIHIREGVQPEPGFEGKWWTTETSFYLYFLDDDTLTPLPAEMGMAVINMYYRVFDDGELIVFVDGTQGVSWDVNVRKGLKIAELTENGSFSVTGLPAESGELAMRNGGVFMTEDRRFAVYAAPVGTGEDGLPEYLPIQLSNEASFRVFDRETEKYTDLRGRFIALSRDSGYVIYEDPSGFRQAYALREGKSYKASDPAVAEALEGDPARYELTTLKSDRAGKYQLKLTDCISSKTELIDAYADAWNTLGDCLYFFDSDSMTVTVRRLSPEGESFEIALPESFAKNFFSAGPGYWNWSRLKLSPDGKTLLVFFETYAEDYFIWVPHDGDPLAGIPEWVRDYPSQYWRCENVEEIKLQMIGFRDMYCDLKASMIAGADGVPAEIPFDIAAEPVIVLQSDSCETADPSVTDGKQPVFSVMYDCTTEGGIRLLSEARAYLIDGERYISFDDYKTVKVVKDGEWLFSYMLDYYGIYSGNDSSNQN